MSSSCAALAQSPEFSEPWKNPNIALAIDPYERNEIDWDKLATDPRVVAIIHRATIGDRVDRLYEERKIEAKKRGYKWGAYHFGKPGSPIKQADFFLETVQPEADDLIALDLESEDATKHMSFDDARIFIKRWVGSCANSSTIGSAGMVRHRRDSFAARQGVVRNFVGLFREPVSTRRYVRPPLSVSFALAHREEMRARSGPGPWDYVMVFVVDAAARTAEYIGAFEKRAVKLPPAITSDLAQKAFDQLWEAFDREYAMFVLRPEVDWERLRDTYRARGLASKSTMEFAQTCAEMLRPLRDLHVWLTVAGNQVPVFNRERMANANPAAFRHLLGREINRSGSIQWTITSDRIGFIACYNWNGSDLPKQFDAVLEKMGGANTVGLVIDVRLNGGGSEDLAREVAGRFLQNEFVYAYSQFRNGPGHTNLTEKFERRVKPRGPWRYERPVVLLIGQKCMSSSESFVAMMSGAPQVTTMGDHTCGSSGNPRIVPLPLDMTVSVPRWIDYLPDGTPLAEKGFAPKNPFTANLGAFVGERDDLLSAALDRLRSQSSL